MTNYINMYATIASSGTLGINTDIFETNILNLSVVVGALVYYGRDTVTTWYYWISYLIYVLPRELITLPK